MIPLSPFMRGLLASFFCAEASRSAQKYLTQISKISHPVYMDVLLFLSRGKVEMKKSWISVTVCMVVGMLGTLPAEVSHLPEGEDPTLQNVNAALNELKAELAPWKNLGDQPTDAVPSAEQDSTQPEEPTPQPLPSQEPPVQENADAFYKGSDGRASVLTKEQYRELAELAKILTKTIFEPTSAGQEEEVLVWIIKVLLYYGEVHGVTLTADDPALQIVLFNLLSPDETEDALSLLRSYVEKAQGGKQSPNVAESADNSRQETAKASLDKAQQD